jgi:hypothetical protein
VGFDGIWRVKNEPELIIEVKTTDYVTVSLEKLAEYRRRLVEEKRVAPASNVLIVVGREDTGALEAQVRGSRYAWDMRLISIDGLMKLVQIKEKSDDEDTLRQIRTLLQPFEYTKVDQIIMLSSRQREMLKSNKLPKRQLPNPNQKKGPLSGLTAKY